MTSRHGFSATLARIRRRLASEEGYTVIIAMGVMVVSSLLVAAAYSAVQGDTRLTQRDLDAKRAYFAARAGVNKFLSELNQNPNLWQHCPTSPKDSNGQLIPTPIAPGSGQKYTYKPVPANGHTACSPSPPWYGDPISTLIDADTGTFRMQFTGYSGNPEVSRGLVASFRKDTPLDFLWFTVYETLDPSTYNDPASHQDCDTWHRDGRPAHCSNIVWVDGDDVNGPAYTQDQYMINNGNDPVFGRPGTNDQIESAVPSDPPDPDDICTNSNCQNAVFHGEQAPSAPIIAPPPDNDELLADAQRYGVVYSGLTEIVLQGNTARIRNCRSTPTPTCTTTTPDVPIGKAPDREPIIYVNNVAGGQCTHTYSPYNVSYSSSFVSGGTGPAHSDCGIVYVSGNYNQSLTIAADADVIIEGPISKLVWAPAPLLGLVANNFVRVMHGVSGRPVLADKGQCGSPPTGGSPGSNTEIPGQTLKDLRIDAAILAIKHSFIVDNYDCGDDANVGELIVNGAIAQFFRGTVGTTGGTGYLKEYSYDDRLAVALPPYLFDIASSSWHIFRETLCVPGGSAPSTRCTEPGT